MTIGKRVITVALSAACGAMLSLRADDVPPIIDTLYVKGETYIMGNHLPKRDRKHHDDEPKLKVTVKDFNIGKTRVTATQFCEFLNSLDRETTDPSAFYYAGRIGRYNYTTIIYRPKTGIYIAKMSEEPSANQVTWRGAFAYCQWLSKNTGKTYRLPTEAEWELAARRKGNELGMCKGVVGEWCLNRWKASPSADEITSVKPHIEDLSSQRSIRGQRRWQKASRIPFPFAENSMHGPAPWTRQHQAPSDISAAWYGFRILEEIPNDERSRSPISSTKK